MLKRELSPKWWNSGKKKQQKTVTWVLTPQQMYTVFSTQTKPVWPVLHLYYRFHWHYWRTQLACYHSIDKTSLNIQRLTKLTCWMDIKPWSSISWWLFFLNIQSVPTKCITNNKHASKDRLTSFITLSSFTCSPLWLHGNMCHCVNVQKPDLRFYTSLLR